MAASGNESDPVDQDAQRAAKRVRVDEETGGDVEMQEIQAPKPQQTISPCASVQQLMKQYYSSLFPVQDFCKWLSYGNDSKHPQADPGFLQRRELCFTLDGDIFVRYQSFKNAEELRAQLIRRVPSKIDIGPVYTVDPQRRSAYTGSDSTTHRAFLPLERELVFDIDLTDYDDVRTCGKEGHICSLCWPLMAVAINILDRGLRQDFGFQHILWVFSGRRGIHCWVADRRARLLTDEQRSSLANYFSVYRGTENGLAKLMLPHNGFCHPSIDKAIRMCDKAWREKILLDQGLLEGQENWNKVLKFFGDEEFVHRLDQRWSQQITELGSNINTTRWNEIELEVAKLSKKGDARRSQNAQRAIKEILLAHCYPRLDVEVSKKMNHLLKAPFCVHPKTGKVCVPIDPDAAWEFDPDEVPTVHDLIGELKAGSGQFTSDAKWELTSLAPSMSLFQQSFLQPLVRSCQKELNEKAHTNSKKATLQW